MRRLEISLEEMRAKSASRYGYLDKQNAEISRLQIELDRKMAPIFALRTREEVRKGIVRRTLKSSCIFIFERAVGGRRLWSRCRGISSNSTAEVSRLQLELDKRIAPIFALRTREEVRKGIVRTALKIVLYFYVRTSRRRRPLPFAPEGWARTASALWQVSHR